MLIEAPGVMLNAVQCRVLLDLALPEAQRRQERGRSLDDVAVATVREMEQVIRSDRCSDERTDVFRAPIVDGVSTATAADALGISSRAVVGRLHRGTLRGSQQPDGRWLVDTSHLAELGEHTSW